MMRQYELVERVLAYNPHADENLLNKAYVYAMQKHGSQKRASGDPFIQHPLEVAAILTELKLDDATVAVGLLHDTIEDTDATRAEIDQLFGSEIGDGAISPEDLREDLIHSLQKYVEVDEPERHVAPLLDSSADQNSDTFDTISEDELLRGIESLAPPERRDD